VFLAESDGLAGDGELVVELRLEQSPVGATLVGHELDTGVTQRGHLVRERAGPVEDKCNFGALGAGVIEGVA
jgi:hypothetical protein